jgi:cytochrome c
MAGPLEDGAWLEAEADEGFELDDEDGSETIEGDPTDVASPADPVPSDGVWAEMVREGRQMVAHSRKLLEAMHEEDREETINLNERVETALTAKDAVVLKEALKSLRELLFFVEGKQ